MPDRRFNVVLLIISGNDVYFRYNLRNRPKSAIFSKRSMDNFLLNLQRFFLEKQNAFGMRKTNLRPPQWKLSFSLIKPNL